MSRSISTPTSRMFVALAAVVAAALATTNAHAGVAPDLLCKDKKGKAVGKYTVDLTKSFGKNKKTPDAAVLASAISKAHSKITKGFTKAEDAGGCATTSDVSPLEAKTDAFVADILAELTCPILRFQTVLPGGNCGRINDNVAGTGTDLTPYGGGAAQLDCGTLYIGGGASVQPPSPTPDGETSLYAISSCSNPTAMVLAATTSTDTGSTLDCTAPGCLFGPPLPIPNAGSPGVSTCLVNAIAAAPPVGGTLDAVAGSVIITLPLTVSVYVTGDLDGPGVPVQPCPKCVAGTCDFGPNAGGTCTTPTSLGSSHDCPPPGTALPPFLVDLSPLNSNPYYLAAAGGAFCPGQTTPGCFGSGAGVCEYIEANGSAAGDLTGGGALPQTLASVYCIPATGAPLVNAVANLPGPGAVTLKGTSELILP